MPDLETTLSLEADLEEACMAAGEIGASLEVDKVEPTVLWLTLSPLRDPEQSYYVRVAWEGGYPQSPPSVKFADGVIGCLNVTSAWPVIPGYRSGEFDICQPSTAEGYKVHPEWVDGPEAWPSTGNPLLWVIERLISDMTNNYQGRSG
jgi:hypothetical protein